ncbi:MAG: cysteine hydrolase [Patescibacteria group bacterium]
MKIYEGMNPNNTALMVIDPVNSCANEKCESSELGISFSKIREMLPKLNEFAKEYRKKIGGLVVSVRITPWRKDFLPDNLNELYKDPKAEYYSEDKSGFDEQFYMYEPQDSDLLITKNTYDTFTSEELLKELQSRGIKYIVMTGIFTDGCVLSSVINGFSKGYNFIILKDLVETVDSEQRQRLQKLLLDLTFPKLYGRTVTSEEFLKDIYI